MKLWGAIMILTGCSGIGLSLCQNHRRLEQAMRQLIKSLEWMVLELNYRMPPLRDLCYGATQIAGGTVSRVFDCLASELDAQLTPDVSACMAAALAAVPNLPSPVAEHFRDLGMSLGQFDLQGQISALEAERALCKRDLDQILLDRHIRLRNYRTLGFCAGLALVIFFI